MSSATKQSTTRRSKPLPEPFRESVEAGWGLDPWVLLPLPFASGLIFGWDTFPLVLVPTLIAYMAVEAIRHRRRDGSASETGPSE